MNYLIFLVAVVASSKAFDRRSMFRTNGYYLDQINNYRDSKSRLGDQRKYYHGYIAHVHPDTMYYPPHGPVVPYGPVYLPEGPIVHGVPYSGPYGDPYGTPYSAPYGAPYGTPYGTPYGNPYDTPYGVPYGNAPNWAGPTIGQNGVSGKVSGSGSIGGHLDDGQALDHGNIKTNNDAGMDGQGQGQISASRGLIV